MPLQPATGTLRLPLDEPSQVAALLTALREAGAEADPTRRAALGRDLGDHFDYLAGAAPQWFAPFRADLTALEDDALALLLNVSFGGLLTLLDGAEEALAPLLDLRGPDPARERLLAAIGGPQAAARIAAHAAAHDRVEAFAALGIDARSEATGWRRFTLARRALVVRPLAGGPEVAVGRRHPVGLPPQQVLAEPASSVVTWHYASLATADVPGLAWPLERVHLVAPRVGSGWTLHHAVDDWGRLATEALLFDDVAGDFDDALIGVESDDLHQGELELRPFDASLTYHDGHVFQIEGVVGWAGGPPRVPPPTCPVCERLMVHVLHCRQAIRPYGSGSRSLFVCGDCRRQAVVAR